MKELSGKITNIFSDIKKWLNDFIDKITTRLTGTPYSKNTKDPLTDLNAEKNNNALKGDAAKNKTDAGKEVEAANPNEPSEPAKCINGCPIDMATGNVVEWRTDIEIVASLGLSLKRFYHSGEEHITGVLGSRWRTNWDATLTLNKGTACFTDWQYSKAHYVIPTEEGEKTQAAHLPQWTTAFVTHSHRHAKW